MAMIPSLSAHPLEILQPISATSLSHFVKSERKILLYLQNISVKKIHSDMKFFLCGYLNKDVSRVCTYYVSKHIISYYNALFLKICDPSTQDFLFF